MWKYQIERQLNSNFIIIFVEKIFHLLKHAYVGEKRFCWEDYTYAYSYFWNNFMKTSETSLPYFSLYCNEMVLLTCCLLLHNSCMQMQK